MPEDQDPIERVRQQTRELIQKHGFAIHFVMGGMTHGCTNIHTHGLEETFKHPELQIVLPIDPETSKGLLHCAVDLIRSGTAFEVGKSYPDVLANMDVWFIRTKMNGADGLRMILPDPQGNLDQKSMASPYVNQYYTEEVGPDQN